jgi:hypothetical protein
MRGFYRDRRGRERKGLGMIGAGPFVFRRPAETLNVGMAGDGRAWHPGRSGQRKGTAAFSVRLKIVVTD